MKFAFLIMGEFDSSKDYASIHENEAQMIGVASIEEARNVARKLQEEGVDCIELCGAFGENGAREIIEATGNNCQLGMQHIFRSRMLYTLKRSQTASFVKKKIEYWKAVRAWQ